MLEKLLLLNLEVTQKCSLNCQQCYCTNRANQEMDLDIAKKVIRQAKPLGLKYVNISGGETLYYSQLYELLSFCTANNIGANIAISGLVFDEAVLHKLLKNGVYGIFISLNGSTAQVNSFSRNGFEYAINALRIISKSEVPFSAINWVMQSTNVTDFPSIVKLAEKYNIQSICILMKKRDFKGRLEYFPSEKQIYQICKYINDYQGRVQFVIDKCFSQLKAVLGDWILGNTNIGKYKGCTAGIDSCSVNVDGSFSPCRHLDFSEKKDSIEDYWYHSEQLRMLRHKEFKSVLCKKCNFYDYCRPCFANAEYKDDLLEFENGYCPFLKIKEDNYNG